MVAIGDSLPSVTLKELVLIDGTCTLGPRNVDVRAEAAGKTIALFAVPGAFTPTCSNSHLPGYIQLYNEFKAAGVDEIWCVSVNDAFVMGAWGKDQQAEGKVRMIADGDAEFTKALDLVLDLVGKGLGVRSQRYSLLVQDGVIKTINIEDNKTQNSFAPFLLDQAKSLQ
ncbi:hypothetical protein DYB32_007586 [Aphanomyces invadans]|uniref:Thioredoxin domain-containing protein n=1 Tax=Aphanomyces invadans TaxID=157072 RepID=A0A418AVM6_9STRA|nr:hypothetical protein DYB32_007586 [Aphanomyces invadans]